MSNTPLRPAFTQKICGWLQRAKSVNIFGTEGKGILRLADDLKQVCPTDTLFVRINIKSFVDSYDGFLQALADGLSVPLPEGADIRLLVNSYLTSGDRKTWLCLTHFDRLSERQVDGKTVDTNGYDIHFLNYLNSLSNNPKVALLVLSGREIQAQELFIGGRAVSGSRLEFSERIALPDLTMAEIEARFEAQMPAGPDKSTLFSEKPPFYNDLIHTFHAHYDTLGFLDFVTGQHIHPTWTMDEYNERLLFWKKEHARLHAPTLDKRIGWLEKITGIWAYRLGRVLSIGKIWSGLGQKTKVAIGLAVSTAFALWHWGKKVWMFLCSCFSN